MSLMKKTEDLGRAFSCFNEANELHKRIRGSSSGAALCNMARCLFRAVDAQRRQKTGHGGSLASSIGMLQDVAPGLPPAHGPTSIDSLIRSRASLGVGLLGAAAEAGGISVAQLVSDPDLRLARELEPKRFAAAVAAAHARGPQALGAQQRPPGKAGVVGQRRARSGRLR